METKPTYSCTFINIPFVRLWKWLLNQPISRCINAVSLTVRFAILTRWKSTPYSKSVSTSWSWRNLFIINLAYFIYFDEFQKQIILFDEDVCDFAFVLLRTQMKRKWETRKHYQISFFLRLEKTKLELRKRYKKNATCKNFKTFYTNLSR